jgi:hypothetical protein
MKKKIIHTISNALLVIAIFSSCEDYVKGISEFDPTLPRDASLGQVINSAEVGLIGFAEGDIARMAGIFTGQFAGADRQYVSYNNYVVTAQDFDSQWANIYSNVIKSLRIAQEKASTFNNKRALGLARILEAYTIGMTAALFGDVPFAEVVNIEEFPNPQFQNQVEVYAQAIALLDQGIADITSDMNSGVETSFEGDIFGGGDADWIARANTIKAKFYLHLKDYTQAMNAASAGISPDQEILATHGASYLQNFNVYYSFLTYDRPGYMTADNAIAPALLDSSTPIYRGNAKTDETARFLWYYYPEELNSKVNEYDINVLSAADGWVDDESENGFFAAEASFPILTYAENQLILAESLLRNGDMQGAIDALNAWRNVLNLGYRISPAWQAEGLLYESFDAADFSPGGIENADNLPAEDALYREIIEEKYISLLGTLEVFNDMRRTGTGTFSSQQNWQVLGITPNAGSTIPQRFLIAQTELNSNTQAPPSPPGLFDKTEVFE